MVTRRKLDGGDDNERERYSGALMAMRMELVVEDDDGDEKKT